MCSSAPPPSPDYTGAAQATASGNLDAARAAAAANRVNQVTPYGNLTYKINGKDSYGNDLYTAIQSLTPEQQKILDANNSLSLGLISTANSGLQYANGVLSKPGVDTSALPSVGIDPGKTYQDAIMSRLKPQIDQQNQQFEQQMANQGIAPGTQAYDNAKRSLSQQQNDLMTSSTVNGFNTGLAANQNAFQQASYNQMQPINVINALRTGSQVQNPNFVSVPQQATTAGADLLGAASAKGQYDMNAYNAEAAGANSLMSGLFGLGAATLMGPIGSKIGAAFSDIRLKENIKLVGKTDGGLPVYTYNYIGSNVRHMGVMAQDVEQVMPDAVVTHESGYKMVDYGKVA